MDKFTCIYCQYNTNKKYDYNRHISSKKHLNNQLKTQILNINNYNNEDYSHISLDFYRSILKYPIGMIPIFIKKLHFMNRNNSNIKIINKNDGLIYIYKNNKWNKMNRSEFLETKILETLEYLDVYWIRYKNTFNNFNIKNYNCFIEELQNNRKIINMQKRECEMVILNYR